MPYSTKRLIGRFAQTAAFYRLVPPGPARVFSGLRYHYARNNWSKVTQLARTDLRHTTEYRSSGMLAARAGFYLAEDDLAETIIERLLDRFPAEPLLFELRAVIRKFQGRPSDALADAERARFLVPSSRKAVAQVIEYSYLANPPNVADRFSLDELRRYPRSTRLYLAAARGCRDAEQFERILRIWREFNEPESIVNKVHPLALAADRAGEIETACELYRDAIQLAAQMGVSAVEERRSDLIATLDVPAGVHDVMSAAGMPYFFAGGSTLALARHGGRRVKHDGNVDIGVFENDWNRSSLEEIFSADPRFALKQQHPKAPSIGVVHRSNIHVNIFRFYFEHGKLWHDSIFSRTWNTPFGIAMHRSGQHVFPLPSDLTTYLQEAYGDAEAPAARRSEEAPNIEVTWPEYARLNRLRRAFEQVCTGDLTEAAKELVDANEGELASVIEVSRG
jgi:hypothetical protein